MAQNEAGEYLRDRHCRDQWADTDDVHDAFEIVGQYVQRHFCADPFHGLHLEVCIAIQDLMVPKGCSTVSRR